MIETLLHLKQDDVVILFSFSRLIAETQALLSVSRKRKLSTIAITDQEALA
ncbi:SIS domain-containing protein, partial [Halolactibacillus alkaliphilus]